MNKPEFLVKAQETAAEKWEKLQPRERYLLIGTVCVILVMIVFTVFNMKLKELDRMTAETENYRRAVNYINDNKAIYQINHAKNEAMLKRMRNADPKVVNNLISMASTLGFDVTVTPKDAHKTSDDSGIEEQEIEVSLKSVDYTKFIEYLVQIHKLETPMYMRRIDMKRASSLSNSDTKMNVSITLISYRLKEQNAT